MITGEMKRQIVEKLRQHLENGVDTECEVVYLLAELRKLLDEEDPNHTYASLWMYCHWALHVDLESPKTTITFLKRVDLWLANTIAYLTRYGNWKFNDEATLFHDFVYLQTLRREMESFLKSQELPATLCTDDPQWFAFLAAYASAIEDGSLSMATDKNHALTAVKEVTFQKEKSLSSKHHVNFVIRWTIALKDGRTVQVDMDAQPGQSATITAHHIKVINGNFVAPDSQPPS